MTAAQGTWEEIAESVLVMLREGRDAEAWATVDEASTRLETRWSPPAAGFREVGRELYWTHTAVPEYVRLQQEQIRRLEAEPDQDALVPALTGALYDLASFTWPGWGHEVPVDDVRLGAAAAKRCVELREDPSLADREFTITPGMAHWVLGAHLLAAGDYPQAREQLALSGDETLARGYLGLVDLVEAGDRSDFDAALAELDARGDDDAAFYREQLVTAAAVLGGAA